MLDADSFDPTRKFASRTKKVVITMFNESPRIKDLIELANNNQDLLFVWVTDLEKYDFEIPENVKHVMYRQWHWRLLAFKQFYPLENLIYAKDKQIDIKFSSLSFKKRQSRALVTATLLNYFKNQSIVSWHDKHNTGEENLDIHQYLIDSLRDVGTFNDIDWSVLEHTISVDNYNWTNNIVLQNALDINNDAYRKTLINFSNETDSYGYYNDGVSSYTRPGPYLTEKTTKCLVSGTVLFSVCQPFVYDYLRDFYFLPINYSIDMAFDKQAGDIDRLISIHRSIINLGNTPLQQLVEENIPACQEIQEVILSPEYMHKIYNANKKQDKIILDYLNN